MDKLLWNLYKFGICLNFFTFFKSRQQKQPPLSTSRHLPVVVIALFSPCLGITTIILPLFELLFVFKVWYGGISDHKRYDIIAPWPYDLWCWQSTRDCRRVLPIILLSTLVSTGECLFTMFMLSFCRAVADLDSRYSSIVPLLFWFLHLSSSQIKYIYNNNYLPMQYWRQTLV